MKKTLLHTVAALTPLTLLAQNPDPFGGGAGAGDAAPAVVSAPATDPVFRLPEVKFDGQSFRDVVDYLLAKSQEAGADPFMNPLNIVISPGLEDRRVPDLLLRNVTPTDVLSIATTVLNLRMEPVQGDGGRIVAWVIKDNAGQDPFASGGGGGLTAPPPATADNTPSPEGAAGAGGVAPGTGPSTEAAGIGSGLGSDSSGAGGLTVPAPVAIASSPAPGGMRMPAPAAPGARVFGVGPLITPPDIDTDIGKKKRGEKYMRLNHGLQKLADDQGLKADIRFYDDMDIIVVKSADPAAIALIAEAIQAMKSNVDPGPTATGPQGH